MQNVPSFLIFTEKKPKTEPNKIETIKQIHNDLSDELVFIIKSTQNSYIIKITSTTAVPTKRPAKKNVNLTYYSPKNAIPNPKKQKIGKKIY